MVDDLTVRLFDTAQCRDCGCSLPGKTSANRLCRTCSNRHRNATAAAKDRKLRYAARYPLYQLRCKLKRRYGLTIEGYQKMLHDQQGRCAICGCDLLGKREQRPHIDHNHATGQVRGLLCVQCNAGLGMFRDSAQDLRSAIDYLAKWGTGG